MQVNTNPIPNLILPRNILVSVFDKSGLDKLVQGILDASPEAVFYSTGGTGKRIQEILDENSHHYISVEDFTDFPEMPGGLVKTLHPKIHAGLLAERNNEEMKNYVEQIMAVRTGSPGVYFDMLVNNLYPFEEVIKSKATNSELARVNIDVGGPTMTEAAAKNWHSIAVVTTPDQYDVILSELKEHRGVRAKTRFDFATIAMRRVGDYRNANADYLEGLDFEKDVAPYINIVDGEK